MPLRKSTPGRPKPASPAERLEALARTDPALGPLARLLAIAVREAEGPALAGMAPPPAPLPSTVERGTPVDGRPLPLAGEGAGGRGGAPPARPLLHEATLQVDADRARRLVEQLADAAAEHAEGEARDAAASLGRAARRGDLDVFRLLAASVALDDAAIESLAVEADLETAILGLVGQLASLPLLLGIGRACLVGLDLREWSAGSCPLCGAWPTLAELRGLERRRRLRCGRCGADWSVAGAGCIVCPPDDGARQTYLAPEASREARRVATCDRCQSYLKEMTTIQPIPDAELGLRDLETIELDLAATEHGFERPAGRAFPLVVAVEAAERRRSVWTPWR